MRIAIDYKSALPERVGIGRYTHNLVKSLSQLDHVNEYLLFCFFLKDYDKKLSGAPIPSAANFGLMSAPIPVRITRFCANRFHIPIEGLIGRHDVVHFPEPYPFRAHRAKIVVTVHDIAFERFPDLFTKEILNLYQKQMKMVTARADALITVSQTTKDDLIKIYGLDEDRIYVVQHGVEESFKSVKGSATLTEMRQKYNLPEEFVLHVGTIEPRKNQVRLIQAFQLMSERLPNGPSLVICGKKGWMCDEVFDTARRSRLRGKILFTGYVGDHDLPYLYKLARAVAYPSLYEGFGLPVIEAMACGRPVLTSNRAAMAEVACDAALLVNPEDVEEIADGLYNLISDRELRKRLVVSGLRRASSFTWERAAKSTLAVYEKTVKGEVF
ncbi:glycosyltransferase family 1 protein [candidate division TA06 bacterium]|uniref:Glycosyltransferase family 1 protein n=1 Tax=candidate division TA06 bacterium TaxID=2250710 RepID=A0A523XVF3_UNCT6|nr:MAG: glycosyltransferase family 1 protein [candidate division TA06 bacterium]